MNKRKAILILATLSLVASIYFYYDGIAPDPSKRLMEKISKETTSEVEVTETSTEIPMNTKSEEISALQEINTDVLGIIEVPGTNINYPILKSVDNGDYLYRDIYKKGNKNGSVFMDYECPDLSTPDNVIIYGHNMKNTNMFSDLLNYRDGNYFEEHNEIVLYDGSTERKYEVVGALVMDLTDKESFFQFNSFINKSEEMNTADYLKEIETRALHFKDIEVTPEDKLITLSTCAYDSDNARFLIVGVEK